MKTDYEIPQIEIIEIELESVLCTSLEGDGDTFGNTSSGVSIGNR